ncbi:MAG: PKD domain-containing protein [Bacteroidota bacterium]
MKQIVPIFKPQNQIKKLLVFVFSVFVLSGSLIAQNLTSGGTIAANQTICPGPAAPLTNVAFPAGAPSNNIEYMWMFATEIEALLPINLGGSLWTPIADTDSPNYDPGILNTTTFFVRCARIANSGLPFVAESNPVIIDVNQSPTAIINGNPGMIFTGATVNFSASLDDFGSTYSWDLNGDGFPDAFGQNASFTYNTAGTFTISLTVTNQAGCVATSTATIEVQNTIITTTADIADPCNCNNPFNIIDVAGQAFYNADYILINSTPGQTWTISNIANFGGGIFDGNLVPYNVGQPIPETGNGVYELKLWFNGALGGWEVTVTNGNGLFLTTGPGQINPCPLCPQSPLPVELNNFDANVDGDRVALTWETAAEVNNSHFLIERSLDGTRFEELGIVEGAGTTSEYQYYKFDDEKPVAGESYYRLKQVDFDGAFEYSDIKTVRIATDEVIVSVSPNPVHESAVVRLGDNLAPDTNLELLTPSGQVVRTFNVQEGASSIEINIADLPEGIYMLSVENSSREQRAFYRILKF